MSPLDFLRDLAARGVSCTPRAGKLVVDAPAGVLSDRDREMLARHKADLLAILTTTPTPADLPADWHFRWDERAAVLEFDGGLPRERAEAVALVEVLREMERAGGRMAAP